MKIRKDPDLNVSQEFRNALCQATDLNKIISWFRAKGVTNTNLHIKKNTLRHTPKIYYLNKCIHECISLNEEWGGKNEIMAHNASIKVLRCTPVVEMIENVN